MAKVHEFEIVSVISHERCEYKSYSEKHPEMCIYEAVQMREEYRKFCESLRPGMPGYQDNPVGRKLMVVW